MIDFRQICSREQQMSENMRAKDDAEWQQFLLDIGDGKVAVNEQVSPFAICLPPQIVAPEEWTRTELAQRIFPDLAATSRRSAQPDCPSDIQAYFCDKAIPTSIRRADPR